MKNESNIFFLCFRCRSRVRRHLEVSLEATGIHMGLRLPASSDADIEKALTEGKILRTHLLRPTWHFVSAKDIYWLLELTAPRVQPSNSYMYRKLQLGNKILSKCNDLIIKSLQGQKEVTRDEVNLEFKKHKILAEGHRLSYIMMNAELEGLICNGSKRVNQFTYALLSERITRPKSVLQREEAISLLATRYFSSRSPATLKDFSTWSGLTLSDCKKGIASIAHRLQKRIVKGVEYYFDKDIKRVSVDNNSIYLLSIYDEFIMGYKDREAYFVFKSSLKHKTSLRFDCLIVSSGQVVGTWKRKINTKDIEMNVDFFSNKMSEKNKEFGVAIKRFEEFNNRKVKINNNPGSR